jgi:hypothetical protein
MSECDVQEVQINTHSCRHDGPLAANRVPLSVSSCLLLSSAICEVRARVVYVRNTDM